jgi:hypothetical protein
MCGRRCGMVARESLQRQTERTDEGGGGGGGRRTYEECSPSAGAVAEVVVDVGAVAKRSEVSRLPAKRVSLRIVWKK